MEEFQDSSESPHFFEISRRIDAANSSTNFDSIECSGGMQYKLHFMR
ncbi:hypothetical protein ATHEMM101B_02810 [Atlantibacter hermannii]|nr:Uncharacterised protein [Atlantibacter hermannii]